MKSGPIIKSGPAIGPSIIRTNFGERVPMARPAPKARNVVLVRESVAGEIAEIGGAGMSDGVVLLHGLARTAASMAKMARALEAAGFATLNVDYPSRRQPLDQLADGIHRSAGPFAVGLAGRLHVVTHSMGGLLARAYVTRHRPARLGRVIMLGPPNQGSEVADLLHRYRAYRAIFGPAGQQLTTSQDADLLALLGRVDYELGIIAGRRSINLLASALVLPRPNDGRVTVNRTRLDGMADHIVVRVAHPWLICDATVIAQTIAFLREGRFVRAGSSSDGTARDLPVTPP